MHAAVWSRMEAPHCGLNKKDSREGKKTLATTLTLAHASA